MPSEQNNCLACTQQYTLSADDFVFYEKMNVAPPRVCPDCQLQRRLTYRNERSLYSRKDSKDGNAIISFLSQDKPMPVYSQEVWRGDSWDPMDYGRDYDFSRPFFEQYAELIQRTPWPALININPTNSEYCNYTGYNKNCYLVFGGDYNENCAYASFNMHTRDSMDLYFVEKCELCYELSDSQDCYRVLYSQYAVNCSDSMFLYTCNNCTDCLGCVNIKNKQYCILNQQYTKIDYDQKLNELNPGNRQARDAVREQFEKLKLTQPHQYSSITYTEGSTGNNLSHVKDCINCFEVYAGAENCKNLFLAGWNLKDSRNSSTAGFDSELIYDSLGVFEGCSKIRHSYFIGGCSDIWYSIMCRSSNNLLGCFGLKHKSYCILNKQYSQEEYNQLVPKIIEHMNTMPYHTKDGYVYQFGDYFPTELSPFAYNETSAQEYFPLTLEKAILKGYPWKETESNERTITIAGKALPASIQDIEDDILRSIIGCDHAGACMEQCTKAFKLVPRELEFYRSLNLPIPSLCPNCRHYQRMKRRNPIKLWERTCMCAGRQSSNTIYTNTVTHAHSTSPCPIVFETPYAPDRPEIIYCEECYKAETV